MPSCLLACVSPLYVVLKLRSSCCLLCFLTPSCFVYFSSLVGLAFLFLSSFLFLPACPSMTLVSSLPWLFARMPVSSRQPLPICLCSRLGASPGIQRRLSIAVSPPLFPAGSAEAGLTSALFKLTICWWFCYPADSLTEHFSVITIFNKL